ncbi:Fic family protein [Desulfovibrio sp. JC010]|uniref:Fic family protein n=1 Tax=Desulfovibrio sp. JC010 TaxID=2593641 RepID=UPI0013D73DB1|nr:Fic family protein [Desulfovibrio sp. JC010]NDV28593.1 Fic family protein [Desulfovibrio sp. JC010]
MLTQYQHITPLSDEDKSNGSEGLSSIFKSWMDIKNDISENSETLKDFHEKLARSWSIETGVIEGIYTIDEGTTTTLIEHGFVSGLVAHDASNLDENELYEILNDQKEALDWVFAFVKEERKLTTSYIKELHALLTNSQHSLTVVTTEGKSEKRPFELKGTWKNQPNNPQQPDGTVFHYCPPEQVAQEMDNLVEWYQEYSNNDIPPEMLAAWLHHRFVLIHPFQDGNGRVARALASIVLIKAGLFPLNVKREERKQYIDALKKADGGELKPLSDFFAELQSGIVYKAIDLARAAQISQEKTTNNFSEKLKKREFIAGRANRLTANARELLEFTTALLKPYIEQIDNALAQTNHKYTARSYEDTITDESLNSIKSTIINRKDLATDAQRALSTVVAIKEFKNYDICFIAIPLISQKFAMLATIIDFSTKTRSITKIKDKPKTLVGSTLGDMFEYVDEEYTHYDAELITYSPFFFSIDEDVEKIKDKYKEWFDTAITLCLASLEKRVSGQ